jgi:hypothetical protein
MRKRLISNSSLYVFLTATTCTFPTISAISDPIGNIPKEDTPDCSSYVNIDPLMDFKSGQTIRIKLDMSGTNPTKKIYVRLVEKDGSYDNDQIGIGKIDLSKIKDDIVEIKLKRNYDHIKQLSIHGGLKPFGTQTLRENAGTSCPIMLEAEVN